LHRAGGSGYYRVQSFFSVEMIMPNSSRQPTPGDAAAVYREPVARRGCVQR
jgi:hypothetical protein